VDVSLKWSWSDKTAPVSTIEAINLHGELEYDAMTIEEKG
jgi:hypothetical protein